MTDWVLRSGKKTPTASTKTWRASSSSLITTFVDAGTLPASHFNALQAEAAAPRSTLSVGLDEAHNSIKVAIMWSFNLKIVILMILVMDQKKNRNYPLGKAFNPHLRIGLENLTSCQDEIISQQRYSVAFILQPHPLVGRCLELSTLTRFSIC